MAVRGRKPEKKVMLMKQRPRDPELPISVTVPLRPIEAASLRVRERQRQRDRVTERQKETENQSI